MGLFVLIAELIVTGSYFAPVFGQTWLWFGATLLVGIGVPVAAGIWLVRPLEGFKRAAWFTGVLTAVPLLLALGLSAGAPKTTATLLRKHGHWLFDRALGPTTRSSTTRLSERAAQRWADLLYREQTRVPQAKTNAPKPLRKRLKKPPKPVFFTGLRRGASKRKAATTPRGPRTQVHFVRRGGAILLPARIQVTGPTRLFTMILDTGATLTTISPEAARRLGIRLSTSPIMVELETAAGPRRFPIAVVRRLRVGTAALTNVTVAICDQCSPQGISGLLGLNFTQHFLTTIDPRQKRLTLQRQAGKLNRLADVEPFIRLTAVKGATEPDGFAVQGKVHNQSTRTIHELTLDAVLLDTNDKVLRRLHTRVRGLRAGRQRPFEITGATHRELVKYRLEISYAAW